MSVEIRPKRRVSSIRCLPESGWPEPDRQAWAAARQHGSLLDDNGLASAWAASTKSTVAGGYGRWLTFLSGRGLLDSSESPSERVTIERIEAYIADLRKEGNASGTMHIRILQLCRMLDVMAPGSCPAWLRRVLRRLRAAVQPVRDDRARLVPAARLENLSLAMMDRAESHASVPPRLRAVMYRDGLMLAIFLSIAPRVGNFASLKLGQSFLKRGPEWWAVFPAREVKNRRPINLPVRADLTPRIERYLEAWRPVLVRRPGGQDATPTHDAGFLWLGRYGGRFGPKKVSKRINEVTLRELGQAMNPHLFRKLQPTELAIHDPAHVGISPALLSHGSPDTYQKAYNLARSLDAARRVHAQLAAIRGYGTKKKA